MIKVNLLTVRLYGEVIQGCQTGHDGKEWSKWELMGQMGNYTD